jgi:iron(III) transport system substrate-binding protein
VQRVLAERSRGRFTADVTLIGSSGNERLRQSGALAPLEPQFIHPEVVDRSHGWVYDRQVWLGAQDGYIAAYKLYVRENITDIYYNTEKVTAAEIESVQSWWELSGIRNGRDASVAVMDPSGQTNTAHIRTPWVVLGRPWFDKFIRNQRPTLLPDTSLRELADGMARGKYHVSLFAMAGAERDMDRMAAVGIPVKKLSRTLAEGTSLSIGGGIAVLERAPHPSAAKLFVNWYLSRDGQNTCQTLIDSEDPSPSLRTDVEQGRVSDYAWDIVRNLSDYSVIETDPEVAFAENAASVAFINEVCADVGLLRS